jgi:hypothetical protein
MVMVMMIVVMVVSDDDDEDADDCVYNGITAHSTAGPRVATFIISGAQHAVAPDRKRLACHHESTLQSTRWKLMDEFLMALSSATCDAPSSSGLSFSSTAA